MRVFIKEPGKKLYSAEIRNSLATLQKIVGGYIETVTLASDMVLICNEEGKLRGLPHNFQLLNDYIVGTAIFAGVCGEHFGNVPVEEKELQLILPQLFEGEEQ